jgi:phosphatidylserine/phosphatidylglycerophosphate/cardiolipin synthase-like enzyme
MFAAAESSIDIAEMYMLYYPPESRGRLLYPLYDALVAAAGRGVRVRVLLDGLTWQDNASRTYRRMGDYLAGVPGIEVRRCDLAQFSSYPGCLMHAKYCVIDGRLSVVGSHNWSWGAFAENRELSLAIDDTGFARALGLLFEQDWRAAVGEMLAVAVSTTGPARLAFSGPGGLPATGLRLTDALAEVAGSAARTLDVEVNSLATRDDIGVGPFLLVDSVLRAAARRGAAVRLLVDHWAWDHEPALFRALDSAPGITVRVADIRAAGVDGQAGTAHAKLVVADRARAMLGTATMSQRQLLECRNVAVLFDDRSVVETLTAVFERDWGSGWSRPVVEMSSGP